MKLSLASSTKQDSFSIWEENRIFVYPKKSIVPGYLVHYFLLHLLQELGVLSMSSGDSYLSSFMPKNFMLFRPLKHARLIKALDVRVHLVAWPSFWLWMLACTTSSRLSLRASFSFSSSDTRNFNV